MKFSVLTTAIFVLLPTPLVLAQSSERSAVDLPKACVAAAQASARMMDKMQGMDRDSAMQGMTETQKGLSQAMMAMHPAMMQGMMAKDADVAWICAMIPHHQGAIDMARAGLKGADNSESKQFAEETIKSQEKEIAKLVAWVEKHAERESRDETKPATKQK